MIKTIGNIKFIEGTLVGYRNFNLSNQKATLSDLVALIEIGSETIQVNLGNHKFSNRGHVYFSANEKLDVLDVYDLKQEWLEIMELIHKITSVNDLTRHDILYDYLNKKWELCDVKSITHIGKLFQKNTLDRGLLKTYLIFLKPISNTTNLSNVYDRLNEIMFS